MLRHLYPEERSRSRAIGVWAAVSGLALAVGPVLGGALVGVWSWRAIFWFNLAFGLAALAAAAIILPESADPDAHRVDTAGALVGASALAALVFAVIEGESTGYSTPWVGALFGASLLAAAAFAWQERRAPHPLLDLRFLRVPRFATANVVAFCSYFATFAIFFFTALYLEEVAGYSGYRIALAFAPMAILMILASLLVGRRAGAAAPRWLITGGCLLFGVGLLLTNACLSPQPPYLPLVAALALAGVGLGTTVVPVTSSALDAVPAERSGMAASATNTSREMGAVTGVAVLGAVVNAELRATLTSKLNHLGIPPSFQALVIHALETGAVPPSGKAAAGAPPGEATLVRQVIQAAYTAFQAGLHVALYLSAGLVLGAGLLAALTLPGRSAAARRPDR
jgi:predicted MFS family arabinose efflux permease